MEMGPYAIGVMRASGPMKRSSTQMGRYGIPSVLCKCNPPLFPSYRGIVSIPCD
jgi:hypothetical protein